MSLMSNLNNKVASHYLAIIEHVGKLFCTIKSLFVSSFSNAFKWFFLEKKKPSMISKKESIINKKSIMSLVKPTNGIKTSTATNISTSRGIRLVQIFSYY